MDVEASRSIRQAEVGVRIEDDDRADTGALLDNIAGAAPRAIPPAVQERTPYRLINDSNIALHFPGDLHVRNASDGTFSR